MNPTEVNRETGSPAPGKPLVPADTKHSSWARRAWIAFRRFILGRSDWDYVMQFTGSDAYWDNAIAAQLGWPKSNSPKPDANRPGDPGKSG